jgi:hypothetical protein
MGRIEGNPGNTGGKKGRSGRKPKGQDLAVSKWYEDILPAVFGEVKIMLESKVKSDRLWAIDWLKAGLVKLIPQKIGGDKDNPIVYRPIYAGLSKHNSNSQNISINQENTGSVGGNSS